MNNVIGKLPQTGMNVLQYIILAEYTNRSNSRTGVLQNLSIEIRD